MKNPQYYPVTVRGVIARSGAHLYEIKDGKNLGYVDAEHLAKNPNDALAGLVGQGMTFLGPKRAYLMKQLAAVENFEPENLLDRIGHNGEHFVYPTGEVFSPKGCGAGRIIFTPPSEKCHRAGSLDDWLAKVAVPLAGHRICEFFMMIPFAGPLRSYTRYATNFGWEIVGEGATGKTVLLQLMCSASGGALDGDDGNFGLSFNGTNAGIESEMQNYSDLAMMIDEGNLFGLDLSKAARGRAFSQLLMALGKGKERHRYRTASRTFKFVFATTSNETLLDIVGGTSAKDVTDAVAGRLMTISLAHQPFGIFDQLPEGYEDVGDLFANLIAGAAENHGLAMPYFLQQLVQMAHDDREGFVRRIKQHMADFRRRAGIEVNAGSAARIADAFGLIYAAGRLAIHFGSLPPQFDPLASTLACYRIHRSVSQPDISVAAKLVALLDDPDVINLDDQSLPKLSKYQFDNTKAFRQTNRHGQTELLIPLASIRRQFPNWSRIRRDNFEVARMLTREDDRYTVHRKVREGSTSPDRVICIVPDNDIRLPNAKIKRPLVGKRQARGRRRRN